MMRGEQCRRINKSDQEYFDSLDRLEGDVDNYLGKAQVAGMKRLLACLVNEGYLDATMTEGTSDDSIFCGKFLVLKMNGKEYDQDYPIYRYYIKLVEQPFIMQCGKVPYLDPDECGATLLREYSDGKLQEVRNPVDVMRAVCQFHKVSDVSAQSICDQIANSVLNQQYLYLHPPKEPSLYSSVLEWEQSLVEGHATHPMHRSRLALSPMASILPSTKLKDTTINFIAVERDYLTILGPFEDIMRSYLLKLGINFMRLPDKEKFVVFPVHCLQLPNIFLYHSEHVRLLPFTASAQSQSSIRTLNLSGLPEFCLKVSLGLIVTSVLRTISPKDSQVGFNASPLLNSIVFDKERLIVAKEVASACCNNPDVNTAKHMAAVFRQSSEWLMEGRNEYLIPSCALTELNDRGLARVIGVFQLNTIHEKVTWFKSYAQTFLEVFLPMVVRNGFMFEAHPQNTLLRVDKVNKQIKGFIIRDLDGIHVHLETLQKTTGILKPFGEMVESLKIINIIAYHTHIRCHLNRFLRALGLHYDDSLGWEIVVQILIDISQTLPRNSLNYGLFEEWLHNPKSYIKCFIKRKIYNLGPIDDKYFKEIDTNLLYLKEV